MNRHNLGLALVLITLIMLEAARVYVWYVQSGVYEYSVAVYIAGVLTPVGVVGALMLIDRKSKG